jgi:hypothetical protein
MKKAPALQVEEISGDQYPDLDAAQRAALPLLSSDLQAVIRDLLERGELVNNNGKIDTPKQSRFDRNGKPSRR